MTTTNLCSPNQTNGLHTSTAILAEIRRLSANNKELCLTFPDGNDERIWAHAIPGGVYLDSEGVFDSSAAPSETEPLLIEAGIRIEYEPMEWFYGFHATADEDQMVRLLTAYTAFACGTRDIMEGGDCNA